jgi:hypothetical protein
MRSDHLNKHMKIHNNQQQQQHHQSNQLVLIEHQIDPIQISEQIQMI